MPDPGRAGLVAAPDPGELRVRGGVGGVTARLVDLDRAGRLLRTAADELAEHGRVVLGVSADPRFLITAPLAPTTFATAQAELAAVVLGPGGLFALAARMERLGRSVRTVAEGYQGADQTVAGALGAIAAQLAQDVGLGAGALLPGSPISRTAAAGLLVILARTRDQPRDQPRDPAGGPARHAAGVAARAPKQAGPLREIGGFLVRRLAAHSALTEAAIPVLAGAIGGFTRAASGGRTISARAQLGEPASLAEVVFGLATLGDLTGTVTTGSHWFRERSELELRVRPAPRPRPASGIADLLARIPVAPNDHPAIHVERIDSALGRSWTVSIPGTANWSSVAGRTPFDATGNVRLISSGRSAGTSAVLAAMRATGIRQGEPVLLVGHSQGGLIAATVAADPATRREFSVSQVVTSGAPVASIPVSDRVQVLSVEHSDDLVPRLDGAANPDRPNWLTVSAPAPAASLPPGARTEPLVAHRLELYRRTAERIDASTDPSVLHWRAGLSSFLGEATGPVSGAAWDVEVSRSGFQPGGEVASSAR